MHDDLKRKIAASLDLPEDASPDPDVVEALENDPQAHAFARGLYVIEGAMQNWPDSSRSASEWEKMAATIERRLGEAPWEKAAKVRGAVTPLSWDPLGAPPLRESEDVAPSVSNVAKVAERKPMSRPDDRDDDDLEGLAALTKTSSGPSSTSLAPTPRTSLTPGPSISDDAMDESSGIVDIQKLAALALKGPPPPKTDELKPTQEESGADHDTAMLASQVVPSATEGERERKASVKAATPAAAKSAASVPAATAAPAEEKRKGGGILWAVLLVAAGGAGVFVVMNQNRSSAPSTQTASSEPGSNASGDQASASAGSAPAPAAATPAAAAAPTTAAPAPPAADPTAQANAAGAVPLAPPSTGTAAPGAPDNAAAAPGVAPPSPPAPTGAGGQAAQLAMNTPPPAAAAPGGAPAGGDQPSARAARTASSDHGSAATTPAASARPSSGASGSAGATAAVTPPATTGSGSRATAGSGSTGASTTSAPTTASASTTATASTGSGARAGSGATASAGGTGGSGGGGSSIDDLMARAVGRTPGSSSGSTAAASGGGGGGSGASSGGSSAGGASATANSGELPDRPSRSQVTSTMAPLTSAIRACSQGQTGMATVAMTVASDGSVTNASVSGPFNGAAISCMTGVVRRAHFPAFRRPSVPILYPFSIQPRNGGAAE